MAMQCKICSNKKRLEIDRAIVSGGNLSKIAKEFGVPYTSLYNHAQEHVSRQLAQAWEKKQLEADFDMLGRIDEMLRDCRTIFRRNFDKGKDNVALKALGEQRNTFELLAKISYSLHQAKLAEIELMRHESGEPEQAEKEEAGERLKILSTAELKVYQRIQLKLRTQNPKIKALTQTQLISGEFMKEKNPVGYYTNDQENAPEIPSPQPYSAKEEPETEDPEPEEKVTPGPRPIPGQKIPGDD